MSGSAGTIQSVQGAHGYMVQEYGSSLFFLLSLFFLHPVIDDDCKVKYTAFFWLSFPLAASSLPVQVALACCRASGISVLQFVHKFWLNHSSHELYHWEGRDLEEIK